MWRVLIKMHLYWCVYQLAMLINVNFFASSVWPGPTPSCTRHYAQFFWTSSLDQRRLTQTGPIRFLS